MPWDKCHGTSPMISQYCFRQWLGAVRQQAITWANVDLIPSRHMASPGHNVLNLFEETYKNVLEILYHSLTLKHLELLRFIVKCTVCWWRGDAKCQGISSNRIDLLVFCPDSSSFGSGRFDVFQVHQISPRIMYITQPGILFVLVDHYRTKMNYLWKISGTCDVPSMY